MKTIGIIGGMSWESTAIYYQLMNRAVKARLDATHSAKLLISSYDFAEIAPLQRAGNWASLTQTMIATAQTLEQGGADLILIATNTMHKMADDVQAAINVPLLHIVDATCDAIRADHLHTVALLGTRFTMEGGFWAERAAQQDVQTIIPTADEREVIHRIIYEELIMGVVRDASRNAYLDIINALAERGAQGVVLGCTEIGMLITPADCPIPVYDTTELHALAAVEWAIAE